VAGFYEYCYEFSGSIKDAEFEKMIGCLVLKKVSPP
jgi:hypothetical protein